MFEKEYRMVEAGMRLDETQIPELLSYLDRELVHFFHLDLTAMTETFMAAT
jgi:hypothetical protein